MSAAELVSACIARGLSIATAESLTAGMVSAAIAEVPGCSAVFRGGVVAYATDIKHSLLGLDNHDLVHVVSEPVVADMARRACEVVNADLGLATTGVAGPDPLDGQAAGSVWIAVHERASGRTTTRHLELPGDRAAVRAATTEAVLSLATTCAAAASK